MIHQRIICKRNIVLFVDVIHYSTNKMSTDNQAKILAMLGFNITEVRMCSLCNRSITASGLPLPTPCTVCGNDRYCVACSSGVEVNGVYKAYCKKHSPFLVHT